RHHRVRRPVPGGVGPEGPTPGGSTHRSGGTERPCRTRRHLPRTATYGGGLCLRSAGHDLDEAERNRPRDQHHDRPAARHERDDRGRRPGRRLRRPEQPGLRGAGDQAPPLERARPSRAACRRIDVHAPRTRGAGSTAGIRGGQREVVVRCTAGERSESAVPRLRDCTHAPARLQGGALAVAGSIHALVAIDDGIESQYIQSTLPDDGNIEIVGIINGIEESWRTLQETSPDLLVIACAGYSDRALYF